MKWRMRGLCKEMEGMGIIREWTKQMAKIRWLDEECNICGHQLNSWDKRLSKALAYKHTVCEKCIAKEYDMDVDVLRSHMEDFFGLRPCEGI